MREGHVLMDEPREDWRLHLRLGLPDVGFVLCTTSIFIAILVRYGDDLIVQACTVFGNLLGNYLAFFQNRNIKTSEIVIAAGAVLGPIGTIVGLAVTFGKPPNENELVIFVNILVIFAISIIYCSSTTIACWLLSKTAWWSRVPNWKFAGILGTLAILTMVVFPWPYRARQYHGSGRIVDHGIWSVPRYEIFLANISVGNKVENFEFSFSGVPSKELNLEFRNEQANLKKADLGIFVTLKLVDSSETTVCSGNYLIKNCQIEIAPGLPGFILRFPQFYGIKLRSDENYRLIVNIKGNNKSHPTFLIVLSCTTYDRI